MFDERGTHIGVGFKQHRRAACGVEGNGTDQAKLDSSITDLGICYSLLTSTVGDEDLTLIRGVQTVFDIRVP